MVGETEVKRDVQGTSNKRSGLRKREKDFIWFQSRNVTPNVPNEGDEPLEKQT